MSGVLMKISVLYKKLNTVGLFYNFLPPPPHFTCALKNDGSLGKIKNTISVLGLIILYMCSNRHPSAT